MKPSITCVSTFGFIIALGKSFSTLTVVAPGVVLGGGPLLLAIIFVVVTVVLVVAALEQVPKAVVVCGNVLAVLELMVGLVVTCVVDDSDVAVFSGELETTAAANLSFSAVELVAVLSNIFD